MNLNTIIAYEKQFEDILNGDNTNPPYDNVDYINYVKLNQQRIRRWDKSGKLIPEFEKTLNKIVHIQHWLLITEPWCGDAAHTHAFIKKAALTNSNIFLQIQNRDTKNSEIDKYLTNGGKSIPKLIVRDKNHKDLFIWGPRPKEAQEIALRQKEEKSMSFEKKKIELQSWYNKDKGMSIQNELNALLKSFL